MRCLPSTKCPCSRWPASSTAIWVSTSGAYDLPCRWIGVSLRRRPGTASDSIAGSSPKNSYVTSVTTSDAGFELLTPMGICGSQSRGCERLAASTLTVRVSLAPRVISSMISTSMNSWGVSSSVNEASRTVTVKLDNETSTSRGFLTTRSTQNVSSTVVSFSTTGVRRYVTHRSLQLVHSFQASPCHATSRMTTSLAPAFPMRRDRPRLHRQGS